MIRRIAASLLALAAVGVVSFATSASVRAQQPTPDIDLAFANNLVAGTPIEIDAVLEDPAGNPIAGASISFSIETEFLNNTADMTIGGAVTGQDGIATLEYAPRIEGERLIKASFDGNEVFASAEAIESLAVQPGPELYRELSPVRIPGANKWMAAAVLLVVWGVFTSALIRVWIIGRIGASARQGGDA